MNNKNVLNKLNGLFDKVLELKIEVAKNIAVEDVNTLLDYLDAKNEAYEIWIGYYENDGFVLDYTLNDDGAFALMDVNGRGLITYLLDYYDNNVSRVYIPSKPTVAIKIRIDNDAMHTYYIEYDGYNLNFDLE
jgi:hypothetical protein